MFHNRKPKSCTPNFLRVTLIHPVKPLKYSVLVFLWNTHTCIFYHNLNLLRSLRQKNAHASVIPVILNRIIADIINCLFQKCTNCLHLHTFPTDIKMHVQTLRLLLQTLKRIFTNLINIHRLPYIRSLLLIKLGNLDYILNQLKQSLRFFIDTPRKLWNILILHQTTLHNLRKS